MQRIGEPLGRADQHVAAGLVADRHDKALAARPGAALAETRDMVEQMSVDGLRGAAQREFAQGRQVRLGKEMAERARRLGRDIDLALLQPRDQLVGGDVDDFDLGIVKHRIGHRLAHADAGEAGDDVVEALDMLDVERAEHVDPGLAQLLDVLPTLGMAATRRIGVREFVDQRDRGVPREHRVEIEFF